jgi:hypothetical protein
VWRNLRDWCSVDGFRYLMKFLCWIYPAPKLFGQFKTLKNLSLTLQKSGFFHQLAGICPEHKFKNKALHDDQLIHWIIQPNPHPKTICVLDFHCLYVHSFRFYFTPLTGVLFAFPSRYWFTIGQLGVFSLGGWSPHVQSKCHVFRPTRFILMSMSCTGLSPGIAALSRAFH